MSTNDGGPAFPDGGQANYTGGLTVRDYFAAKALVGVLANPQTLGADPKDVATAVWLMADAMLAARSKTT